MKKISFVVLVALASLAAFSANAQENQDKKENHLTTFCDSGVVLEQKTKQVSQAPRDASCETAVKTIYDVREERDALLEYFAQAKIVYKVKYEPYEITYPVRLAVVDKIDYKQYIFLKPWPTEAGEPKLCRCIQEPPTEDGPWVCQKQNK